MQRYKILWADDEIELLKPHILFLEGKSCDITAVNSGVEAIEIIQQEDFDLVFLDESMPGLSGLEVLSEIQKIKPNIPVVMVTKNEEEYIMEEAIGSKIADYLIKPINPKQILLSVKKILDNRRLVSEKVNSNYQQEFQQISMTYNDSMTYEGWIEVYKKLVHYEIEIDNTEHRSMKEVLEMQKTEANGNFRKFFTQNYEAWINDDQFDRPLLSQDIMEERVFPLIQGGEKVFFLLVDNLRFDQWKEFEKIIDPYFKTYLEDAYFSILPTTTQYARNAIFSGMLPLDISKKTKYWKYEDEEGSKNNFEQELLGELISKNASQISFSYNKITNQTAGNDLVNNVSNLMRNDLNVVVYNFVDMLSHARTDSAVIKELARDEAAYRSLSKSWLEHSSMLELLRRIKNSGYKVIITTDHGTIRVKKPTKIVGDRNTNTNLRYKVGKNLSYNAKEVFEIKDPERFGLPKRNMSTSYVFAQNNDYFVYKNNYNHFAKIYGDTFQHGGISMEEVIIPFVELVSK